MNRVRQCTNAAFFMVLSFSAAAYPHSFIGLQDEPIVKNDLLNGFEVHWAMDEIISSDLLHDAGNAKPGSEVQKKLTAEAMANVPGQHYFSELWRNGQRVEFGNHPDGYGLERGELQAVLTFTLLLVTPQPVTGQTFTSFIFDPTYYVDMLYDKDSNPSLPATLRAACRATVMTPKPSDKMLSYAQSLDKADAPPKDMALGSYFTQKMTLICQ